MMDEEYTHTIGRRTEVETTEINDARRESLEIGRSNTKKWTLCLSFQAFWTSEPQNELYDKEHT